MAYSLLIILGRGLFNRGHIVMKFHSSLSLFCLSFLITFTLSFSTETNASGRSTQTRTGQQRNSLEAPPVQDKEEDIANLCAQKYETAFEKACNEKTYSSTAKLFIAAFQTAQKAGDIKKACETAKELNNVAQVFNFRTSRACSSALNDCISICEAQKADLTKPGLAPPTDPQVITQVEGYITTCRAKQGENRSSYTAQAAANAQAYANSDRCSQQTSDTLASTGSDLPDFDATSNNGSDFKYQDQNSNQNLNRNRADPDHAQAVLDNCLQNPSSEGCQSIACSSLPDKNIRHVCHEEGFEFICTQFPQLSQCKHITASNSLDCSTLPPSLQRECESEGAIAFCQKHSESERCKEIAQADASETSGFDGGGSGGSGGSAGGGSFAGGSSGDFAEGLDEDAISGLDSDEPGIDDYLSDLEDRPFHSSLTASGSGSYKGRKFKGFDFQKFRKLLAKSKKPKRGLASSNPGSPKITSANGLTNFQKVSRRYQARRHLFLK